MQQAAAITALRRHEHELRALGLDAVALFGSVARNAAGGESDVDLAIKLNPAARVDLFRYAAIADRLRNILGAPVDMVSEPARSARLQTIIDRDRVRVF